MQDLMEQNPSALSAKTQFRLPFAGLPLAGLQPLHVAAMRGSLECIEKLLDYRADVNCEAYLYGATPIHVTAIANHTTGGEVVRLLVCHRADPWKRTKNTLSVAAELASVHNNIGVLRELVAHGVDDVHYNAMGLSLLHSAAFNQYDDPTAVNMLMRFPVFQDLVDIKLGAFSPFCRFWFLPYHRLMYTLGRRSDWTIMINMCKEGTLTPLHLAAFNCNVHICEALLNHGASKKAGAGKFGLKPEDVALMAGNLEALRFLKD
eukprot:TRINITY_DN22971_c0_g1_i2.p1 TRINITY_DN22971_c0_g1~~TRINITY_DN22971_c0_g1_i2.p1  ORF type:complete len:262 (-),score=42.22 TRINITY_DN22971_c0_g1_i2:165-950(-)